MSEVRRESPLVGQQDAREGCNSHLNGGVVMRELTFLGHIVLRGLSDDPAFTKACAEVLGVALPTTPNTQVRTSEVTICWMRPTQWLIITEESACQDWLDRLREALTDVHSGVMDLSGGQTLIQIGGERAVEALSKGTTLDLHPRQFGAGECASTLMAGSTVLIRVADPGRAFDVIVQRTFADHIWRWLRDASEEYGCVVRPPISAVDAL